MIRVYVDESGNMGVDGEYFVLAAAVFKTDKSEARVRRLIRKEQQLGTMGEKLLVARREVKFSRMKFEQRQRLVNGISKEENVDVFYFVAYKPSCALLTAGKKKNLIYNYFSKLLIERVLRRYDDDFEIVFDQRATAVKSMNSLMEYIQISAYVDFPNLTGKCVTVNQADSRTNLLLQAADVVAGAAAQAYVAQNRHFLEMLGRRVKMIDEFPKRGFCGSQKWALGKLQLIDMLRGF